MEPISLYYFYSFPNLVVQSIQTYSSLFYDEECTNLAGYYYISGTKNILRPAEYVYNVSMTLYFNERIITYNYTKDNSKEITVPISFDNLWKGKTPLGYVSRVILNNNLTRKVTIYL